MRRIRHGIRFRQKARAKGVRLPRGFFRRYRPKRRRRRR